MDQRLTILDYHLCNLYSETNTNGIILLMFQLPSTKRCVPNFSLAKTKVVLMNVQYAKNIAQLIQCTVNGDLFRYIIRSYIWHI